MITFLTTFFVIAGLTAWAIASGAVALVTIAWVYDYFLRRQEARRQGQTAVSSRPRSSALTAEEIARFRIGSELPPGVAARLTEYIESRQ